MGEEVALRVTPEVDSLVTPEVEPAVTPEVPESEPDVEVKSTHRQGFPPIQFLGVYHVLMDLEFSTQSKQTKRRYRE
ncbi:hypothetical protein GYMLUDRAFT_67023 [Collybiopsis luxurians FD-317 M1]|nr:hypothetical protein GYMLUDRAFT_67023 [Collybiopsis luxurians FD-317 M1]